MKRCKFCQEILGTETPEGFKIRDEQHKEIFIDGIIAITCSQGHTNYLKEEK